MIDIMVHTHNGILCNVKKNEPMSSAAPWMDLEIVVPSEVRQTEEE